MSIYVTLSLLSVGSFGSLTFLLRFFESVTDRAFPISAFLAFLPFVLCLPYYDPDEKPKGKKRMALLGSVACYAFLILFVLMISVMKGFINADLFFVPCVAIGAFASYQVYKSATAI